MTPHLEPHQLHISSRLGLMTRQPAVELRWGAEAGELTPAQARQHALDILAAAEAAETDALLYRILGNEAWFPQLLTRMRSLREYRPDGQLEEQLEEAPAEDQPPSPSLERLEDGPPIGSSIGLTDPGGPERLATTMAAAMRTKLEANLHKLHWSRPEVTDAYLLGRLLEEVDELRSAILAGSPTLEVWQEAADVANFAAMLADRTAHTWSDPQ